MKKSWYYLIVIAVVFLIIIFYSVSYSKPLMITGFATTDSQLGNLSVGVQTYMACTWSVNTLNVSFGTSLSPGQNDTNATGNYDQAGNGTAYNVTVDLLSTSNADITITGNNLTDGANIINIENVTWQSNTTAANGTNMVPDGSTSINVSEVDIITNEPTNSTVWYRLWIDIPNNTVAGTYEGNYTLKCAEAA